MNGHGFIEDEIQAEDYILGGGMAPTVQIPLNGQWDKFLPDPEYQLRNGVETMNCTAYATLNCIEMLEKAKYGADINYSERYVGIMAGTDKTGNSPHKVAETIRKRSGLITEDMLPFEGIEHFDDYYSPKPITELYVNQGLKWLKRYNFKHEWVFKKKDSLSNKREAMKEALKLSPLGVAVYAWRKGDDGLYIQVKMDNHWVCIFGYKEGEYWKAFDSYDATIKHISWRLTWNSLDFCTKVEAMKDGS